MRYYIKIFNTNTGDFVGYYKETGKTCISRLLNGIKYFDTVDSALIKLETLDNGFIRDKDKHYYNSFAMIYGDSTKEPKKTNNYDKEELDNELETFIRKNRSKNGK